MKEAENVIAELEWFRSALIKGGKAPEYYEAQSGILTKAIRLLEQPEIIYCKDCKYYGRADKKLFYRGADCLNNHIRTIVADRDYCSRAERRTDD